jgi:hypothetical protein
LNKKEVRNRNSSDISLVKINILTFRVEVSTNGCYAAAFMRSVEKSGHCRNKLKLSIGGLLFPRLNFED